MEQYYLDFENPLKEIDLEILELESEKDSPDGQKKIAALQTKLTKQIQKIHGKLSRWEKVQLARHPQRPYTLGLYSVFSTRFYRITWGPSFF